jgi:hypothetical protein
LFAKMKTMFKFMASAALLWPGGSASAQPQAWPKAISDNSFLVEEAYNQEPGVVQHISTFFQQPAPLHASDWSFTQEWPVGGQRHQLSYTLSYLVRDAGDGLGDVLLNYRYQLLDGQGGTAISPRLTFVRPRAAPGTGGAGLQANLPVSRRWSAGLVTHFNAGITHLVRNHASDLRGYTLGASVIGLLRPGFNVLLEGVVAWADSTDGGRVARERQIVLSPGVRGAIDVGGVQIVPGVALPLSRSDGRTHAGVFAYLSVEHAFEKSDPR